MPNLLRSGCFAVAIASGSIILASPALAQTCDSIDLNRNGVYPEDQDVIDFFTALAGGACGDACNPCDLDINNNNVYPEDQDVIDFFLLLAGGLPASCPDGPAIPRRHPAIPSAFNHYIASDGIRTFASGTYATGATSSDYGLFMPPLDCDGWAINPGTATAAFTVHVDSSSDDPNTPDGSVARPYRSIACAFLAVRGGSNYPALARIIRVRRGTVYFETIGQQQPGGDSNVCVPGYTWDVPSGAGPDSPVIVEAYGEPPTNEFDLRVSPGNSRFVLVASNFTPSIPGVFFRGGGSDLWIRNAEIVSESEWNFGLGSPPNLAPPPVAGVQLSNVNRVYLEDCYIHGFQYAVRVDATTAPQPFNTVTLHRCILADSYGTDDPGGQSSGIFSNRTSMLVSECILIDTGWSSRWQPGIAGLLPNTLGMGSDRNHGIYWSFNMDRSLILNTLVIRPSFAAAQMRANDNSVWNSTVLDGPAAFRGGHAQGDNGPPEGGAELDGLTFGSCGGTRPYDEFGPVGTDWTGAWPEGFGWRGQMAWSVALGAADVYARGAEGNPIGAPGPLERGMGFGATLSDGGRIYRCIAASNAPRGLLAEDPGENFFESTGASLGAFGGIFCEFGNSAYFRPSQVATTEAEELERLWSTEWAQINRSLTISDCIIYDWIGAGGGSPGVQIMMGSDRNVRTLTNACVAYPRRIFSIPEQWTLRDIAVRQRGANSRFFAAFGLLGTASPADYYAPNLTNLRVGGTFENVRFNTTSANNAAPGGTYRDMTTGAVVPFEQFRASTGLPSGLGRGVTQTTADSEGSLTWPARFTGGVGTLNITGYMSEMGMLDLDNSIEGELADFAALARRMSRFRGPYVNNVGVDNWDERLTAPNLNAWVRGKFGWSEQPTD